MSDYEIVITPEHLELVPEQFEIVAEQGLVLELLNEDQLEMVLDSDSIEVLVNDPTPDWVFLTKLTVGPVAPSSPKIGELWVDTN